jgi:YidC/Oxa1 family membrane protein insertase
MIGLYGVIYAPLTKVLNFSADKVEKIREFMGSVVETGKNNNTSRMMEINVLNKFTEFKDSLGQILSQDDIDALANLKENFSFMGIDLTQTPNPKEFNALWLIPILAGLTALASSVFMYIKQRKQNPEMAKNPSMGCMTFMSPVMSLWFTFMFPAGVGVYWIISNIISFIQQVVLTGLYSPKKVIAQQMVDETVTRRSRENNVKRRVENEKK